MKKIYLFIALIGSIAVNAQQLPNNSFENWFTETYQSLHNYLDSGDEHRHNIVKSTDAQDGNYAIKLFSTITNDDNNFGYFINFDPDHFTGGIPYTQHVDSVKGYYKAHIVAQDTAWFLAIFKSQGNTVGGRVFPFDALKNTNTWTKFAFDTQMPFGVVPDTLMIAGVSSNALNEIGMEDGSWIMFDNIEFTSAGSPTTPMPNNSFENWDDINVEKPNDFLTSLEWQDSSQSITKTTDASSGNYAIKLETAISMYQDTIHGFVSNGQFDADWHLIGGMPITQFPNQITFDVKNNIVNNSMTFINFKFKNNGNEVFNDGRSYNLTNTNYIHESLIINQTQPIDTVLFVSSTGDNPGTSMTLDNIVFYYPSGVDEYINARRIEAFPNPASNSLNFEIDAVKDNEIQISIFNLTGQKIIDKNYNLTKGKHKISIDISSLAKGNYLYSIRTKSSVFSHKFIKK